MAGRLHGAAVAAATATLRDLCASTAQGMGEGRKEGRMEGTRWTDKTDTLFWLVRWWFDEAISLSLFQVFGGLWRRLCLANAEG